MSGADGYARARPENSRTFRYVARQPIFDRDQRVFGYELLFRNGLENCFSGDADEASRSTLDSSLLMGLDVLCDGRRAFLNCTRDTLIKGLVTLLPSTSTVVEILESVPADPDVIAACRSLKEQGYMIALDDYVAGDRRESLAAVADIIKVEMQLTTEKDRVELMKQFGPWGCRMLAEKIETRRDFLRARAQGFVYFQGYFFRRPEMLTTRDMPANRLHYLKMLQEVSRPELDLAGLEKLIKSEASICYRLLRYLNSAVFGFKKEIHSVKHALSLLGERDVRRWVRLVAAVGAGQEKTSDLVLSALVRGRFGELLAPQVPSHGESDLFLMGLLSLIDVMLEMPMDAVLDRISLDNETKSVLLGRPSVLRPVFQLMLAHESGEWEAAASLSEGLNLSAEDVAGCYWQAQQWARELSACQ
ncbi:MAG TPA: HDOD domain-containing protein [Candidatus Sulfotelmatobacter sp.]|nr:HDOD domain-containing protein [Candidatus Sulfotelmatobacter sp.]